MTTIAYRDGIIAGDGRETCQNDDTASIMIVRDDCVKVHKIGNSLFGAAHGSEAIEILLKQLRKHKGKRGKVKPIDGEVAGLLIEKNGSIWLFEGSMWQKIDMPYYAVGSGSYYAMAAMDAGASAVEAVEIAMRRDPYSGGLVTIIS